MARGGRGQGAGREHARGRRAACEVATAAAIVDAWRSDEVTARAIGVNVHRDIRWFNREAFAQLVRWWAMTARAAGAPQADVERGGRGAAGHRRTRGLSVGRPRAGGRHAERARSPPSAAEPPTAAAAEPSASGAPAVGLPSRPPGTPPLAR